jgi:hypothetical protein
LIFRQIQFFGIGFLFILPILFLAISVLLAIWVYNDAKARGENGAIWVLILLVGKLVGLIIWLVVRPEKARKR